MEKKLFKFNLFTRIENKQIIKIRRAVTTTEDK